MGKDNIMRFRLEGIDYVLKGDMGEERMGEIVALVEDKIAAIRAIAPGYSTARTVTLAALQLAEELAELKAENAEVIAEATNSGQQYAYNFNRPKRTENQ